jgi:hypothetical protein
LRILAHGALPVVSYMIAIIPNQPSGSIRPDQPIERNDFVIPLYLFGHAR